MNKGCCPFVCSGTCELCFCCPCFPQPSCSFSRLYNLLRVQAFEKQNPKQCACKLCFFTATLHSQGSKIQLTRDSHGFKPFRSIYTQICFSTNVYSTLNIFSLSYDFLNNIFFFVAYFFKIRIRYTIYMTYKICVN